MTPVELHALRVIHLWTCVLVLAGCGGGSGPSGTALGDGYGPANPSECPHARLDDVWFDRRLGCLALGQRFVQGGGATGETADRAYIVGQQVLDEHLSPVLGAGRMRHYKYGLCVQAAPANLSPVSLMTDLGVALGLNPLATGTAFIPPGVSGSFFAYGSLVDVNTLNTTCDRARHPVVVNYATGRIASVNAPALAGLVVIDR